MWPQKLLTDVYEPSPFTFTMTISRSTSNEVPGWQYVVTLPQSHLDNVFHVTRGGGGDSQKESALIFPITYLNGVNAVTIYASLRLFF
jgi:hypothetical protein